MNLSVLELVRKGGGVLDVLLGGKGDDDDD